MAFSRNLALTAALLTLAAPLLHAQAGTATQAIAPGTAPAPPAPGTLLQFDVASIHLNGTTTDGHHHIYNDPGVSQFRIVNLSLKELLQFAYDLPESQILGGPSWIDTTMFDIDAQSDHTVDIELHALPRDQSRLQKQQMVQALLADRFHLTVHREIRQLPVYSLVVAKTGPKFKVSDTNGTTIDTSRSRLHIAGSDDTITILARQLALVLGRVVLNNTALPGRFDLTLRWTPDDASVPMFSDSSNSTPLPGIFTAIQEQLGLKLEATKGPVAILVVDHVEEPSPN